MPPYEFPQTKVTLIYEHGKPEDNCYQKIVQENNISGMNRYEFTNEVLKDFVKACGFQVSVPEILDFDIL